VTHVALIGAGMWAPRLAAAAGRAGLELVSVHSRDHSAREALAERFSCRAAAMFDDAIADAEGVILATPNDVHLDQALECAERRRHVFVEKPLADTLDAAERIRDACRDTGVILMVGHAFRRQFRVLHQQLDVLLRNRRIVTNAALRAHGRDDLRVVHLLRRNHADAQIFRIARQRKHASAERNQAAEQAIRRAASVVTFILMANHRLHAA